MTKEPEPWERYEEQIARRFKSQAKNAVVTVNERFTGRKSGATRKVEIVVRGIFPGFGMATMLIDCKNWKKPIGVIEVGEFHAQVDDIGAELGVIVTSVDATRSAHALAAGYRGIKILVQKFSETLQEWEPDFIWCDCDYGVVYLDEPVHDEVEGIGRCDHCYTLWAVCACGQSIDFGDGRVRGEWWACDSECGREWLIEPGDPRDGSDEVVWYRDNAGPECELLKGPARDF